MTITELIEFFVTNPLKYIIIDYIDLCYAVTMFLWEAVKGLPRKDVRSQRVGVVQFGHFMDKGKGEFYRCGRPH